MSRGIWARYLLENGKAWQLGENTFFGKEDRAEEFETDLGAVDPGMFENTACEKFCELFGKI